MHLKDISLLSIPNPGEYIDLTPYKQFDTAIQIQTKRGCALECTYCTYNAIEGHRWRLRHPRQIANDIEKIVKNTGINHIEFTDSTFNIPLPHCKRVLKEIIEKKIKLRLRTMGLNPSQVDEELVDLMKEAGFKEVDLGVESGSETTLKTLGKNYGQKEIVKAANLLHQKKIPVNWFLLLGAPEETRETLQETFELTKQCGSSWDFFTVGIGVRVYKGSPMANDLLASDPQCVQDQFLHPVCFEPEKISTQEIKAITKKEALSRQNFFLYDENDSDDLGLQKLGFFIIKFFAPRQPVWRVLILLRYLEKWTGIQWFRRMFFLVKERRKHYQTTQVRVVPCESPKRLKEAA